MNESLDATRLKLLLNDARQLEESGVLVRDSQRTRPRWFDGRFLAAADLQREQDWFRARLGDLGRASGFGVVQGLEVARDPGAPDTAVTIDAGLGIAGNGEAVLLREPIRVDLADVTETRRWSAVFGLDLLPGEPPGARDGVYVLCLRPVEWTETPTPLYPTSLDRRGGTEDGEIIEGTAVTILRHSSQGARRTLEKALFVDGEVPELPRGGLPVAMLGMRGGLIDWLSVDMVRREVGVLRSDALGLDPTAGRLRAAHVRTYDDHLTDILAGESLRVASFAATRHFDCLPPVGRMPVGSIDATRLTQRFLPFDDVELAVVAADEIPAILEESLAMPPIRLHASSPESSDDVAVTILLPLPRNRLQRELPRLGGAKRLLRTAIPSLVARRDPIQLLAGSKYLGRSIVPPPVAVEAESSWVRLLAEESLGELWFVRRRNEVGRGLEQGSGVRFVGDERDDHARLDERLRDLQLKGRYDEVLAGSTALAVGEVAAFLSARKFTEPPRVRATIGEDASHAASAVAMRAALQALEVATSALPDDGLLTRLAVLDVASAWSERDAVDGLARVLTELGDAFDRGRTDLWLESGRAADIDRLGREEPTGRLRRFTRELADAADAAAVAVVVDRAFEARNGVAS